MSEWTGPTATLFQPSAIGGGGGVSTGRNRAAGVCITVAIGQQGCVTSRSGSWGVDRP